MERQYPGVVDVIIAAGGVVTGAVRDAKRFGMWRRARRARARAETIAEERFQIVKDQMSRGRAGDASEAKAHEALRGRGGLSNPLDERWF